MREPLGSSTVRLIDGGRPKSVRNLFLGAFTVSSPLAYSTWVCSAVWTSTSLEASAGLTSTTVSVRSLAWIWTWPAVISMVTSIGSGGSNVGLAMPSQCLGGGGREERRAAHPAGVALSELLSRGRAGAAGVGFEGGGLGAVVFGVDRQSLLVCFLVVLRFV